MNISEHSKDLSPHVCGGHKVIYRSFSPESLHDALASKHVSADESKFINAQMNLLLQQERKMARPQQGATTLRIRLHGPQAMTLTSHSDQWTHETFSRRRATLFAASRGIAEVEGCAWAAFTIASHALVHVELQTRNHTFFARPRHENRRPYKNGPPAPAAPAITVSGSRAGGFNLMGLDQQVALTAHTPALADELGRLLPGYPSSRSIQLTQMLDPVTMPILDSLV
jgi:hypothetical protein